MQMLETVLHKK